MRSLLDELTGVLRRLHKALIEAEAERFGSISGPFQFLNLVTNHPHFAWLRGLSELMVELDELLDSGEAIDRAQAAAYRVAIEGLIGPRAPTQPEFRKHYMALLQLSPAAAMAHGELRRTLEKLPDVPDEPRG